MLSAKARQGKGWNLFHSVVFDCFSEDLWGEREARHTFVSINRLQQAGQLNSLTFRAHVMKTADKLEYVASQSG